MSRTLIFRGFTGIKNIFSIPLEQKRIFGLDILRAVAIFFVMLGHSRLLIKPFVNDRYYMFFVVDGVTIFFVLSGFLIGGILIRIIEKEAEFKTKHLFSFWIKRWFRTIPNYVLILSIAILLQFIIYNKFSTNYLNYFLFIQNFSSPHPSFFTEAWSLSIEEWFYLIIAFVLFISLKLGFSKAKTIFFWIVIIVLSSTMMRLYNAFNFQCADLKCWQMHVRGQVITRLDSLMFGVLASYILFYYPNIWKKMAAFQVWILGLSLIVIPQLYDFIYNDLFFKNYLSFSFVSIGTLLILPALYNIQNFKGFLGRLITVISLTSYSIYLINLTIVLKFGFTILKKIVPSLDNGNIFVGIFNYLFFWTITLLLSILIYKYFEVPVMKLREKINNNGAII